MPLNKILIVAPNWVGDIVMAQSLLICLKQQYPDCVIDVLAPAWSQDLISRMPEVNQVIALPSQHGKLHLKQRWQLAKQLRSQHYQQAIVLPNSFKSALIPWLAHIPQRTGWRGEMRYGLLNDYRKLDKKRYPKMIDRFCALAWNKHAVLVQRLPFPRLAIDLAQRQQTLAKFSLTSDQKIIVLCPGAAYGPAKRWPERHFAEFALEKIQQGFQIWLLGGKGDRPQVDAIMQATQQQCHDLTATSLTEAIDLMSLADLVVSNDSGLMHIACAIGKPVVVIYGSSDPHYTPPLSNQAKIVSLNLDCSPCFKRECPLGHTSCLHYLNPQQVSLAANELLAI